jgi:hypothetical protein
MKKEHLLATCLAAACGISLLIFMHFNKYKRVERWFYYHNKHLYILLELCYYLLFISFVFNARYLAYEAIGFMMLRFYGIKMKL